MNREHNGKVLRVDPNIRDGFSRNFILVCKLYNLSREANFR